jgi:lipoyl synthase
LSANCPNRYECFSHNQATFMILGNICSRNCLYCNIQHKKPITVDKNEGKRIAKTIKQLKLDYVVITSPTRDDLKDGGINQFYLVVKEIKQKHKNCKIELLIPDFKNNWSKLPKLLDLKPNVINHNIETVKELFPHLRPQGDYQYSLKLLKKIKKEYPNIILKSGLMLGFGENKKQIIQVFKDLKKAGVEILTIGQYLAPSSKHAPVKKYYQQIEFKDLKKDAKKIGFQAVASSPLTRSSYQAKNIWKKIGD